MQKAVSGFMPSRLVIQTQETDPETKQQAMVRQPRVSGLVSFVPAPLGRSLTILQAKAWLHVSPSSIKSSWCMLESSKTVAASESFIPRDHDFSDPIFLCRAVRVAGCPPSAYSLLRIKDAALFIDLA